MRILRNIVLMFFPILIMINLYRFVFANATVGVYEFRGLSDVFNYMSTFNGLNNTFDMLEKLSQSATNFGSTEIVDLETLFQVVGEFFTMVGLVFSIPVMFIVDLVSNIIWVIGIFSV